MSKIDDKTLDKILENEYKRTFDNINAPDNLAGKVINMKDNKNTKKISYMWRKAGYVAAAAVIIAVSSNAITFAATGEGWIGITIAKINGVDTEINYNKDDDGNYVYEMNDDKTNIKVKSNEKLADGALEYKAGDGDDEAGTFEIKIGEDGKTGDLYTADGEVSITSGDKGGDADAEVEQTVSVVEKDGKVIIQGADEDIDITDDMADGKAEGKLKIGGQELSYSVSKNTDGGYSISVE